MRKNSENRTIERNLVQKWQSLIGDIEPVKAKQHPYFLLLEDFYQFHGTNCRMVPETNWKHFQRHFFFGWGGLPIPGKSLGSNDSFRSAITKLTPSAR